MKLIYILLCVAVVAIPEARAEEKAWKCFVAITLIDKWGIEECTAEISMTRSAFNARLFSGDELRHTIVGTRSGNKLSVRLSTEETDLVDYPLTGLYEKILWKEQIADSIGRETITLSKGGIVVGFTREINK